MSLGQFHLAPHSCRIPFHVGEVKAERRHAHLVGFALRYRADRNLCILKVIKVDPVVAEQIISKTGVGAELDDLLRLFDGPFVIGEYGVDKPSKKRMGKKLARVRPRPFVADLLRLFLVSGGSSKVVAGDEKPLLVAGPVA